MTLDEFIENVCQRPMPQGRLARIRTFAKEIAEGAFEKLWNTDFTFDHSRIYGTSVKKYLKARWNDNHPSMKVLVASGYFDQIKSDEIRIGPSAIALLEETEPSTIFISYKRSESSAFALLVLARLKQEGLEPFLDLALEPGEDWHAGLKDRIQSRDYFVLLVGPTTLESEVVQKEIMWALECSLEVIPIWHNHYYRKATDWDSPPDIINAVHGNHAIRVLEESALAYNTVIVQLLNHFGITP